MGMEKPASIYKHVIEAPSPNDPQNTVRLGLRSDTFQKYRQRWLTAPIAEYYAIVRGGILGAQHAFRGVKRPMASGSAMDVDRRIVVYTWRSLFAAMWVGSQFEGEFQGEVVRKAAPPGVVFAVLVREEEDAGEGIYGSIERWNWIEEDPNLPHAPVAWAERYGGKLWSRT
jgi:hypothetical protein